MDPSNENIIAIDTGTDRFENIVRIGDNKRIEQFVIDITSYEPIIDPYKIIGLIKFDVNGERLFTIGVPLLKASSQCGLGFYTLETINDHVKITINFYLMTMVLFTNVTTHKTLTLYRHEGFPNVSYNLTTCIDPYGIVPVIISNNDVINYDYSDLEILTEHYGVYNNLSTPIELSLNYVTKKVKYMFIMIDCSRCNSICQCNHKLDQITTNINGTITEYTRDDLINHKQAHFFQNYGYTPNNYYLIPIEYNCEENYLDMAKLDKFQITLHQNSNLFDDDDIFVIGNTFNILMRDIYGNINKKWLY